MISFYPGPSQVYEKVPLWVKQAHKDGILGINHRSRVFQGIVADVYQLLRDRLQVPDDYSISFVSSATECWEIIAQSFVEEKTFHLYNGSFGEKWYKATKRLLPQVVGYNFHYQDPLEQDQLIVPEDVEALCITQNETSNGTQLGAWQLTTLRNRYPDTLIAVDAVSSMAGIQLPFEQADIWFASVQKCFGLPAGLGLLICSPAAAARAEEIHKREHYNSWLTIQEHASKHQTHYTPNVLNIYLLQQMLQERKSIDKVESKLQERYTHWCSVISKIEGVQWLIENEEVRSITVLALQAEHSRIKSLHQAAKKAGFSLGKGYGNWAQETLRIANFPALRKEQIEALQAILVKV